jgi:predicted O-methyltransferase YrrM
MIKNKFADRIDELDTQVLKKLSHEKKSVFEFGTFAGASAMAMLPQIKKSGGHLWCIDHFRDDIEGQRNYTIEPAEVIAHFINRTDEFNKNLTLIVGRTTEALNFPQGIADLVFVDASHNYTDVKRDIELAQHLCQPGGIISGHDYVQHFEDCDLDLLEQYANTESGYYDGVTYGVIKAVHEIFGKPNKHGSIWWLERP